jgi:hypothetical protein
MDARSGAAVGGTAAGPSLLHRKGKPRVSLGDFHDQSARLVDAENEFGYRVGVRGGSGSGSGGAGDGGDGEDENGFELDEEHYGQEDPSALTPPNAEQELESHIELLEEDIYSLAKSYFDSKELERCKRTLQNCRSKKAMFLRLYSVYLVSDHERALFKAGGRVKRKG